MIQPKNIYSKKIYVKKILTTFLPRWIHRLSPRRYSEMNHWKNQQEGDNHGYDKYTIPDERIRPVLIRELNARIQKNQSVLDLGCNCGLYLSLLKKEGYQNLTGIDICGPAIEYGKKAFDLSNVEMIPYSYEEALPKLISDGKAFDLIYSCAASIALVHPSYDVIKDICRLSNQYVVLFFNVWAHGYPRFLEYEFAKHGFVLVKYLRRPDEADDVDADVTVGSCLSVYQRVK